jgi:hypothetical protein
MDYNIKVNIKNILVNIRFDEKTKIGEGEYGIVYFLSQNNFDITAILIKNGTLFLLSKLIIKIMSHF